jgi:hypothetical protein
MILIEFETNLHSGVVNILKYKSINEDKWHFLFIDIETLNLLITNFGNFGSPTVSRIIELNYCGADVKLCCDKNK